MVLLKMKQRAEGGGLSVQRLARIMDGPFELWAAFYDFGDIIEH